MQRNSFRFEKILESEERMFSIQEKRQIAEEIEKLLLNFNHPEMPTEKPVFTLEVIGKETWSWAVIKPNWEITEPEKTANPWNEISRNVLGK